MGLVQPRLMVVRVDVAHPSDEADMDRPFGPRREVWEDLLARRTCPGRAVAGEQARERCGTDPPDTPVEKLAAINCFDVVHVSSE